MIPLSEMTLSIHCLFISLLCNSITRIEGLPATVFWDNSWPSDLVHKNSNNDNNDNFEFPPSTGLKNPYVLTSQSALDSIGDDPSSAGLADIFNNYAFNKEVEVQTSNGQWISSLYLPDDTKISNFSKFQLTVDSYWSVDLFFNNGVSKRLDYEQKLILALIDGVWLDEQGYNQYINSSPTASPTSEDDNQNPNLLPGTVLFAQSQIIPSKHRNDGDDTQPHLVARRKTLVMLKPHTDSLPTNSDEMVVKMTVYDGDEKVLSSSTIMNTPESIPKQDSWVDLGQGFDIDAIDFPTSLDNPFVIQDQTTLDNIGNDKDALSLIQIMNESNQEEVEIMTENGLWVKYIYLPPSASVPQSSKIQISCNSGWHSHIFIPRPDGSGFDVRNYEAGDKEIFIIVNGWWISKDAVLHNDYIFGHGFYTTILQSEWVQPGITIEFTTQVNGNTEYVGMLDDIEIGAPTELILTLLDAGFLTEPRNQFTFKDDLTTHREYFETAPLSRMIVVPYESLHLKEIMLPDGTFYTDVSVDVGGWQSGDMREYIGKILLSHGIDLANYGIHSSHATSEAPHPFTCALFAAHNTVGSYQNGRIIHGGSGGNGMITLEESVGNEFSHELGHNYDLGHFVDGFKGSVHRPASEVNSSWGWDSERNVFIPNFQQKKSGLDQCLEGQCQSPYLGRHQYGRDSMSNSYPEYSNRYDFYTPNTSRLIQQFLENKAIWDPSSSTGFRKYNYMSKKMEEFVNNDNGNKVPIKFHVPVTTIVGYYDPDDRGLQSYIYPAMHGALGFVYDVDSIQGNNECLLVVETKKNEATPLEYSLSGSTFSSTFMNKFHVNVASEEEPQKASVYCGNKLLAERQLSAPNEALEYAVTGVPLTSSPDFCVDSPLRLLVNQRMRTCKWVGKNSSKRCNKRGVSSHCTDTCQTYEYCDIDSSKRIVLQENGNIKSCDWVKRKNTASRCQKSGMKDTCRETCASH